MSIVRKIKRALRGEVDARTATLEVWRRTRVTLDQKRERAELGRPHKITLRPPFANLSPTELLHHFRTRSEPRFFSGFNCSPGIAEQQRRLFPAETQELLATAEQIVADHSWSLMGLGRKSFGTDIDWNRDPVSGVV